MIEFWWFLEKLSGKIWITFCPKTKVSYILDFLPAYFYKKRKQSERRKTKC